MFLMHFEILQMKIKYNTISTIFAGALRQLNEYY